jgi:hypothetical protein
MCFQQKASVTGFTFTAQHQSTYAGKLPLTMSSLRPAEIDSPFFLTDEMCLLHGADPIVQVEKAPSNSRRIFSGIDILAKSDAVWSVLTNYEYLHEVVPSLVKNEIVERFDCGGARLNQVGGATVFPGVTFTASILLDVKLYLENGSLPDSSFAYGSFDEVAVEDIRSIPLQRGRFPRPFAVSTLPHRDITMQSVPNAGDFEHYQAVWRIQDLPDCAPEGQHATRLSYAVEIKPKGMLPVKLIEGRVKADLKANMEAIRCYVERCTL